MSRPATLILKDGTRLIGSVSETNLGGVVYSATSADNGDLLPANFVSDMVVDVIYEDGN